MSIPPEVLCRGRLSQTEEVYWSLEMEYSISLERGSVKFEQAYIYNISQSNTNALCLLDPILPV